MTKFLAYICLLIVANANTLGLYWFAFGIWPRSWVAFIGFGVVGVALWRLLLEVIEKEKR